MDSKFKIGDHHIKEHFEVSEYVIQLSILKWVSLRPLKKEEFSWVIEDQEVNIFTDTFCFHFLSGVPNSCNNFPPTVEYSVLLVKIKC